MRREKYTPFRGETQQRARPSSITIVPPDATSWGRFVELLRTARHVVMRPKPHDEIRGRTLARFELAQRDADRRLREAVRRHCDRLRAGACIHRLDDVALDPGVLGIAVAREQPLERA